MAPQNRWKKMDAVIMSDPQLERQLKDDAEDEEEEEREQASSDSDTSTWDSDPAIHKTKKQYHPVRRGQKDSNSLRNADELVRQSSHDSSEVLEEGAFDADLQNDEEEEEEDEEKDDDSKEDGEGDGDDEEEEEEDTLVRNERESHSASKNANGAEVHNGGGKRKVKGYRLGDEKAEVEPSWSDEEHESADIPPLRGSDEIQENGRLTEEYETEGRTSKHQAEEDEEDIEEIDLTRGSFQTKYLDMNEGHRYLIYFIPNHYFIYFHIKVYILFFDIFFNVYKLNFYYDKPFKLDQDII